jgi:hypothetical protein
LSSGIATGGRIDSEREYIMKFLAIVAATLLLPSGLETQTALPSGTIIPISLDTSLDAAKIHAGQAFRSTVMQDVPGTFIKRLAKVLEHVLKASPDRNGTSSIEIGFETVNYHGHSSPIKASLRALASFMEVEGAQVPEEGASRGITAEVATTQQIGGEQVYRGGGPVAEGNTTVGRPAFYGVLALPRANPELHCQRLIGENRQPQAFWLFSSDACGVYGFYNIRIENTGETEPRGNILLSSETGKLIINNGSAMLLRILAP